MIKTVSIHVSDRQTPYSYKGLKTMVVVHSYPRFCLSKVILAKRELRLVLTQAHIHRDTITA